MARTKATATKELQTSDAQSPDQKSVTSNKKKQSDTKVASARSSQAKPQSSLGKRSRRNQEAHHQAGSPPNQRLKPNDIDMLSGNFQVKCLKCFKMFKKESGIKHLREMHGPAKCTNWTKYLTMADGTPIKNVRAYNKGIQKDKKNALKTNPATKTFKTNSKDESNEYFDILNKRPQRTKGDCSKGNKANELKPYDDDVSLPQAHQDSNPIQISSDTDSKNESKAHSLNTSVAQPIGTATLIHQQESSLDMKAGSNSVTEIYNCFQEHCHNMTDLVSSLYNNLDAKMNRINDDINMIHDDNKLNAQETKTRDDAIKDLVLTYQSIKQSLAQLISIPVPNPPAMQQVAESLQISNIVQPLIKQEIHQCSPLRASLLNIGLEVNQPIELQEDRSAFDDSIPVSRQLLADTIPSGQDLSEACKPKSLTFGTLGKSTLQPESSDSQESAVPSSKDEESFVFSSEDVDEEEEDEEEPEEEEEEEQEEEEKVLYQVNDDTVRKIKAPKNYALKEGNSEGFHQRATLQQILDSPMILHLQQTKGLLDLKALQVSSWRVDPQPEDLDLFFKRQGLYNKHKCNKSVAFLRIDRDVNSHQESSQFDYTLGFLCEVFENADPRSFNQDHYKFMFKGKQCQYGYEFSKVVTCMPESVLIEMIDKEAIAQDKFLYFSIFKLHQQPVVERSILQYAFNTTLLEPVVAFTPIDDGTILLQEKMKKRHINVYNGLKDFIPLDRFLTTQLNRSLRLALCQQIITKIKLMHNKGFVNNNISLQSILVCQIPKKPSEFQIQFIEWGSANQIADLKEDNDFPLSNPLIGKFILQQSQSCSHWEQFRTTTVFDLCAIFYIICFSCTASFGTSLRRDPHKCQDNPQSFFDSHSLAFKNENFCGKETLLSILDYIKYPEDCYQELTTEVSDQFEREMNEFLINNICSHRRE